MIKKSWHHITSINESTEWVVVKCDDVYNLQKKKKITIINGRYL